MGKKWIFDLSISDWSGLFIHFLIDLSTF
jgi:hypothetical protein